MGPSPRAVRIAAAVAIFAVTAFGFSACGGTDATPSAEDASSPVDDGAPSARDDASASDAHDGPDGATASTPCWPYDAPSAETLRASKKKVFAHYFSPFPLSLDNLPSDEDYYATNYLRPEGENGKFYEGGGFINERPVPQAPRPYDEWEQTNLEVEVRRAAAIGLDGFTYDLLATSGTHWDRLTKLLAAIPRSVPTFRVLLTIDMTAPDFGGSDADAKSAIVTSVPRVAGDPSMWRLDDGRLVLAAFYGTGETSQRSAAFWKSTLDALAAQGVSVAFVPMPTGDWKSDTDALLAAGVPVYAPTTWSYRTPASTSAGAESAERAHAKGLAWMNPVGPQDGRPKNLLYAEFENSRTFRQGWDAAITGGADLVQVITWNDYSEDSEIAPSSRTNNAFYDLTGYFTAWFKTGKQPPIVRDALYYVHRTNSVTATVTKGKPFTTFNGTTGRDEIELLGFLTAPGTLEITIDGTTKSQDVPAGIQSFRAPLVPGTPTFRLRRGDHVVVELVGASPIRGASVAFFDPLYHAGTSRSCPLVF